MQIAVNETAKAGTLRSEENETKEASCGGLNTLTKNFDDNFGPDSCASRKLQPNKAALADLIMVLPIGTLVPAGVSQPATSGTSKKTHCKLARRELGKSWPRSQTVILARPSTTGPAIYPAL